MPICKEYYPLGSGRLRDNGYYCKKCYRNLKLQGIPATGERSARCTRCGKTIASDESRVKDGNNCLCIQCYTKAIRPEREEAAGKDKRGGKSKPELVLGSEFVPKSGFIPARGVTALRDTVVECIHCGHVATQDALKEDKDGKIRCPKCHKELPFRVKAQEKARESRKNRTKEDFAETAQLFKCLGDPCRVKIIDLLSDHELCVFQFVDMLGFQYSAVSYHLKMLKEMGLVESCERGNFMAYSLTDKGETVHEFIEKSMGHFVKQKKIEEGINVFRRVITFFEGSTFLRVLLI